VRTSLIPFREAAIALAGIGIYGLLSYLVQQRTREIGVRAALGAMPRQVAGLITFDVIRFVGIGMVSGVLGAALVAGTLRSQFFAVGSLDPATYLGSFAILLLIAAVAAAVPARRAALVDPAVALRR
jgi:putative ABC transport system permease protein